MLSYFSLDELGQRNEPRPSFVHHLLDHIEDRWLAADRLGRLVQPQRMWKKKMGEATPMKMRKKIPTSRQVLTTSNEVTSQKYF